MNGCVVRGALLSAALSPLMVGVAAGQFALISTDGVKDALGSRFEIRQRDAGGPVLIEQGPRRAAQLYATDEVIQIDTELVLRPMCGSDPAGLTEQQLLQIRERQTGIFSNPANYQVINNSGPSAEGLRGGGGMDLVFLTSNLPAGAAAAIAAAEAYIESQFADPITVTITVDFQNLGGGVLGATGSSYASGLAYDQTRDGLQADMDADDTIQMSLPSGSTLPVRYNGNSDTVTNENRIFITVSNFNAAIGSLGGTAANMTFNSAFGWDYEPPAIGGGLYDYQSVFVHEVGHALGFVSGTDFRTNDAEMLDLYRFQFSDGASDYNPDDLAEFSTTPRMIDQNAPGTSDDVISDIISSEFQMSDGSPNQASHFTSMNPGIYIMDPSLAQGESFFPNFFRFGDLTMFDAIGYDYPPIIGLDVEADEPRVVSDSATTTFTVEINPFDDTLVASSETLRYRYDGGAFLTAPLVNVGGTTYEATLPQGACDDMPEFYVSAESVESGVVSDPPSAPGAFFSAQVGVLNIILADDFESDMGWQGGVAGDTATTGIWERVNPVGTAAQPEDDNTADPGDMCFVTGQGVPGGGLGDNDVDGGTTTLLSPNIPIPAGADVTVSYYRWFSNATSAEPNTEPFTVDVSADGGMWVNAETVGPAGEGTSGGWNFSEFRVLDHVTPTSFINVRFRTQDPNPGSLVEAGVDDVEIWYVSCEVASTCTADLTGDGVVGSDDLAQLVGLWGQTGVAADFDGGGVGASDLALLIGTWGPCP